MQRANAKESATSERPRGRPRVRPYRSTLRAEQVEQTRRRLVDAALALAERGEMNELSLPQVAREADVSIPTAYRHFPTQESLEPALAARVRERLGIDELPPDAGGYPDYARRLYRAFDANHRLLWARNNTTIGRAIHKLGRKGRAEQLMEGLMAAEPRLSKRGVRRAAALFRGLLNSQCWESMREEFGIDGGEAGGVVRWALDVLLRELHRNPGSIEEVKP